MLLYKKLLLMTFGTTLVYTPHSVLTHVCTKLQHEVTVILVRYKTNQKMCEPEHPRKLQTTITTFQGRTWYQKQLTLTF